MYAQIFFVTSLRGSGSVPTMLASSSEGCMGFIKALFFAFGVVFAIFAPSIGGKGAQLRHRNCNGSGWQTRKPNRRAATQTHKTVPSLPAFVPSKVIGKFGGPGRDRTDDLFHAMEARSQLRHRPTVEKWGN